MAGTRPIIPSRRALLAPPALPSFAAAVALALAAGVTPAPAIAQGGPEGGTVEHLKVHSPAIEGNLQGNPDETSVLPFFSKELAFE